LASKREILETLSRARLLELARRLDLAGLTAKPKAEVVRSIVARRSIPIEALLGHLARAELKAICRALGLDDGGREKALLIARLLGETASSPRPPGEGPGVRAADQPISPRPPGEGPGVRAADNSIPPGPPNTATEEPTGTRSMAKKRKKAAGAKRPIEQYEHADKTRLNNPPVGLVTPRTDPESPRKTYQYDPHLDPQLVWAGKAERTSFDVPTVSLHVHEQIDPRTIIRAVRRRNGNGSARPADRQLSMFEDPEETLPLREAVEFYQHARGWKNRLVAGDSLLVMNSLLEKEGMAGKVQMVYLDPPYGIRYGSNFQPFVGSRDVKDGKDSDLTQEPEMIRAFRDTWELGIHSYLGALRDRLLLARDLLTDSGSVFVQISTQNLNVIAVLLDEVFGVGNRVELISFRKKTMPLGGRLLEGNCDYILWYAKDKEQVKYHSLFRPSVYEGDSHWNYVEMPDGERRQLTPEEIADHRILPDGSDVYQLIGMYPTGPFDTGIYDFEYEGTVYRLPKGKSWKTPIDGMRRLAAASRLQPYASGATLRYVLKSSDYSITPIDNVWSDTSAPSDKVYVVHV